MPDNDDSERAHGSPGAGTARTPIYVPPLSDASIPAIFANLILVDVNKADVSLILLHDFGVEHGAIRRPVGRVTMSHQGFVAAVENLQTRVELLKRLYHGTPPSLFDLDQEEINKEFERMNNANTEEKSE